MGEGEIRTGNLSSQQEKQRLNDLKKLNNREKEVEKYLDSGAQQQVADMEKDKDRYGAEIEETSSAWEDLDAARKKTNAAFNLNKELIVQRDALQKQILEKTKLKTEI